MPSTTIALSLRRRSYPRPTRDLPLCRAEEKFDGYEEVLDDGLIELVAKFGIKI
jgi:hypothetical protein